MISYILPLICLVLTLMATLTCLRFILSREGIYWIIPCLISLIFTLENLDTLLIVAETSYSPSYRTFRQISPILIALLWYMMIISFHYALRYKIKANTYRNENKKNRAEAEFIEKMERRKRKKEYNLEEKNQINRSRAPEIYKEKGEKEDWTNLFND